MALLAAKMSKKGEAAALEGVAQFLEPQLSALGGSGTESLAGHDLAAPHEVYTLDLDQLGKKLKGAKSTGWRYFVMSGDHAVAAAEVDRPAKGTTEAPTFSNLNMGGFVASSLAALKTAEELPMVQREDFQFRLLQIPALHVMALWLHGKTHDLLLPLVPTDTDGLGAGAAQATPVLSPAEFFDSMTARAESVARFDDSPEASRQKQSSDAPLGGAAPAKQKKHS